MKTSIDHSFNIGLFHNEQQIGFARVISDFSTIAYLGDVYVLENYRGDCQKIDRNGYDTPNMLTRFKTMDITDFYSWLALWKIWI